MTLRRAVRLHPPGRRRGGWCQHVPMTLAEEDLSALVEEWLDGRQVADRLGISEAKVRTMIPDPELAAAKPRDGAGPMGPPGFPRRGGAPGQGRAGQPPNRGTAPARWFPQASSARTGCRSRGWPGC